MKSYLGGFVSVILCSASSAALAQASTAEGETKPVAEQTGIEDIIVTATRRAERLQDIPVTVTAITSQTAAGAGVLEVRNLSQVVPAFTGNRNAGANQPVIRGVGSSGVSVGDEANVATYIDGVYQADPFTTALDLVEVDRVEVLRGPQGTVFGRNATGGLINVITPDPSFDTSGRIAARFGRMRNDANSYEARAYLTGGLTEKLAADIAGLYRKNDGFIKDLTNGGTVGDVRVVNVRSKLLFQPSTSAKVILTGDYANQKSSTNAFSAVDGNTAGRRFPGAIIATGPWEYAGGKRPVLDYERYSVSLRTQFNLGSVNLETTSAYMHSDVDQFSDSDASSIMLGEIPFNTKVETYSQEVRLLSDGNGRLKWLLGGYAFHLKGNMNLNLLTSPGPGLPITTTNLFPQIKTTSFAGFAEGTYALTDALFLTAGLRYTTENRKFQQAVNGVPRPFGTAEKDSNKWTYRAALRYNFAERANAYLSYGTGFKSGVFNALGTSPNATNPETIRAIEGGIKADPLPWLRTNLAIYHYDYKDLQVQARDVVGVSYILQNAANAKIYGGEAEVSISPTADLNLRGSFAYTHGEYSSFPLAQTFIPLPTGGNTVVAQDVSGKQIIRAPRTSFNLGFDWGHDLGGGRLMVIGNLFHSARVYYDFLNIFSQKPYTMVSGEISWTTPNKNWRFSLWGKNLTNAAVYQQIRPGALSTDGYHEQPRSIGIGAELKF